MANKPTLPTKPPDSQWTNEQWAGIATTGSSVLVSAAAGSGKTAVLAERCAFLVCDAKPPSDIDQLLVVTFTEAAAAEMKSRIERALHRRLADSNDRRLARQLALIDRAQVSTLHGFCAKLIRQHFHLLNLDPAFTVLDGDEAALLRLEVARDLFAAQYESASAERFQALIDAYGDGNDERLVEKVIHTHELLCSLVEPQKWLRDARAQIVESAEKPLETTELGRFLLTDLRKRITALAATCDSSLTAVSRMKGFDKYVTDLKDCRNIVAHWREVLDSDGIDALAEVSCIELPRLPGMSSSVPGKETAKSLVDLVREQIKTGSLRTALAFSSQQWTDGMRVVRPHAEMFLDLVAGFAKRYYAEKQALRAVDFADLERQALKALRTADGSPSPVARMLHKQYNHVLVDEYQDINEVQDAILKLVSRECAGGSNLFCVGDVKQSIYGFRLAEPARFLDRQEQFRAAKGAAGTIIDLQANFRSRAPLLDVLNGVFSRLMTREAADLTYDKSHELRPGLKFPPGDKNSFVGAPVELHLLPHDIEPEDLAEEVEPDRAARESVLIGRLINELIASKRSITEKIDGSFVPRPIKYGDIVILLRAMRYKGDEYADPLRAAGIPVHTDSGSGYFESMEVRDILALLQLLDNRRQDIPMAAVLRSPLAALPNGEDALAQIRLAYPRDQIPFHLAVVRYASERHDDLAAHLSAILRRLDDWRLMAQRRPLADLIWDIYDSTGYLAFCAGLRDGEQRKANLIYLHERARQFGSFQRQGLARFLAFLDRLQDESDLGQPSIAAEGENVVRIMTIHRSKGLEFPVVIIPDLGKGINLRDSAGSILVDRHAHLGMDVVDEAKQVRYPSLASMLVSNRVRQQAMAEELRVLYVAMTRAREHLVLIGTCKDDTPEAWRARWSSHDGALPADAVLGARSMLDWLGPVAVTMRRRDVEPIQVIHHTQEEVAGWPNPVSARMRESERQQRLARFELLHPPPAPDPVADQIIARLTTPYPFEPLTRLAASQAATALAKPQPTIATAAATSQKRLELPRAVRTELKPNAADIGSATHVLLQHLDFTRPCDTGDLRAQLQGLVDKRLIAKTQAAAVDLDAICWLAGGEIGKLVRDHPTGVRRELPLYFALPAVELDKNARSDDPQDRVMIRSRVDLLISTPAGLHLVDYKTDRLPQVELYTPQMQLYRRAIEAITSKKVAAVYLVFLSTRTIHRA